MKGSDPRIVMIWAQASNGVIGAGGTMPWHLPEDFRHFRAATGGQTVIMGRRTWESLPDRFRPLPGRTNIVISGQLRWAAEGAVRAADLHQALELGAATAGPSDRLWIIGGGRVYGEAMSAAGLAVITVIDKEVEGDTFAPTLGFGWTLQQIRPEEGWLTAADGTRYRFETWART